MNLRIVRAGALLACFWHSGASGMESTCYGSATAGRLENGVSLPLAGANFSAASALGWSVGRSYLHSSVLQVVLAAYRRLAGTAPATVFVFGETGWGLGGKFPPHKTHQNGTSVDFMVPVRLGAKSVPIPTSVMNQFGYGIEFDENGRWGSYQIDFEAIGEHLTALNEEAHAQGIGISRVIFEVPLQALLMRTSHGKYLKSHVTFSSRPAWVRHDEHYHVDFNVKCKS